MYAWGDGIIIDAAADVSGASIETVRRWAVHYYLSSVHVEPSAHK